MVKLGFKCPDIDYPLGCSYYGFPNPESPTVKLLNFVAEHPGCTRDDLYESFGSISPMWWMRDNGIVAATLVPQTCKFNITPDGEGVKKFVEWLAPIFELIDLVKAAHPHNFEELDINATLAGKHYLVEEKTARKFEFVIQCYNAHLGNKLLARYGMNRWMLSAFSLVCREMEYLTAFHMSSSLQALMLMRYNLDFSVDGLFGKSRPVSE